MFPKKGNFFPGGNDRENGSATYAATIAQALRRELGSSHRATKTVMHWTGASERTAKHWLAGHHGPGGGYLVVLMRESEAVFEAVLTAAGRRDAVIAARMLAARGRVAEVMALVRREVFGPAEGRAMDLDQRAGRGGPGGESTRGTLPTRFQRTRPGRVPPAHDGPSGYLRSGAAIGLRHQARPVPRPGRPGHLRQRSAHRGLSPFLDGSPAG